jgi:UDP:flavonoid glycosyltransferase YjiC (YdhE family)
MIVFPWGVDQPGNGARIMYHHLGIRGDTKYVTTQMMGDFIDKICNDPLYHQSAKKMQKIFLEQEDCQKAIDFIENAISKLKKDLKKDLQPESRVVIEI